MHAADRQGFARVVALELPGKAADVRLRTNLSPVNFRSALTGSQYLG
jgi:hypothetical protein